MSGTAVGLPTVAVDPQVPRVAAVAAALGAMLVTHVWVVLDP